jgi:hypothetical protein
MAMSDGSGMALSGAGALLVALAMVAVAVVGTRTVLGRAPVHVRLSACCEVVMAGVMLVMATSLV